MSLSGKLETDVEIKASAEKFHEMFRNKPHHITRSTSHSVQGCKLLEGDWGSVGSVIYWNYVHGGKPCVAKEVIEAIDEENNSVTFKVIEGHLLDEYKSFKATVQVAPKGEGSVVHWTLEYEKLHDQIPDSHSVLLLCVDVSKDLDEHLITHPIISLMLAVF